MTTVGSYILPDNDLAEAACKGMDTDIFYPPHNAAWRQVREAKLICLGCPVVEACLIRHIDERYGIWGATTPKQRAELRRRRDRRGR